MAFKRLFAGVGFGLCVLLFFCFSVVAVESCDVPDECVKKSSCCVDNRGWDICKAKNKFLVRDSDGRIAGYERNCSDDPLLRFCCKCSLTPPSTTTTIPESVLDFYVSGGVVLFSVLVLLVLFLLVWLLFRHRKKV